MKLRIGLLTAWANRANGGVFEVVATHAATLASRGFEPHVFSLAHPSDPDDAHRFAGCEITRVPVIGPRSIGYGLGMRRKLIEADLDVLHLHGIWTHLSNDAAGWAVATGRPYVISPHGMLEPWIVARGRLKKAVARAWFEARNWDAASVFQAATEFEAQAICKATGRKDCFVIPNGIDIPGTVVKPDGPPTMVCITRIHPKKNLVALIEGWRIAQAASHGWRLVIAGWGADPDLAQFRAALGASPETDGISFVGPSFGDEKQRLLDAAHFVVMSTFSESMGMSILEAWAAGIPSVMTEAVPLPEGFRRGAAIAMGTSASEIAEGLRKAMALDPNARQAMARAARALAEEEFAADIIADRWAGFYRAQVALMSGRNVGEDA